MAEAGALLMMLAVEIFNRKSIWGKAVVATSNDIDAAGLMGINTQKVITLSYSISAMTAAFAGGMTRWQVIAPAARLHGVRPARQREHERVQQRPRGGDQRRRGVLHGSRDDLQTKKVPYKVYIKRW